MKENCKTAQKISHSWRTNFMVIKIYDQWNLQVFVDFYKSKIETYFWRTNLPIVKIKHPVELGYFLGLSESENCNTSQIKIHFWRTNLRAIKINNPIELEIFNLLLKKRKLKLCSK